MSKSKAKPLPPVVVTIREGPPSPAQLAAFRALFNRLLAPCLAPGPAEEDEAKEDPRPGPPNRRGKGEGGNGQPPASG